MIPAAFGAISAALEGLSAELDDKHLGQLDAEELAAMWRLTGAICAAADGLYNRLHGALVLEISDAYHGWRQ